MGHREYFMFSCINQYAILGPYLVCKHDQPRLQPTCWSQGRYSLTHDLHGLATIAWIVGDTPLIEMRLLSTAHIQQFVDIGYFVHVFVHFKSLFLIEPYNVPASRGDASPGAPAATTDIH